MADSLRALLEGRTAIVATHDPHLLAGPTGWCGWKPSRRWWAKPRAAGSELGPGYGVLEHLARGRALDAYDAWSEERHCGCVVKVLRPDRRGDAGARRRLVAEGRALTSLCHPNIVRGYELVRDPHPLVAMESIGGETVARLVERRGALAPKELAFLGLHLLLRPALPPPARPGAPGPQALERDRRRRAGQGHRPEPGRCAGRARAGTRHLVLHGSGAGARAASWAPRRTCGAAGVAALRGGAPATRRSETKSVAYPQLEGRAPALRIGSAGACPASLDRGGVDRRPGSRARRAPGAFPSWQRP